MRPEDNFCTAFFSVEDTISSLLSACTSQGGPPIEIKSWRQKVDRCVVCTAIFSVEEKISALLSACLPDRGVPYMIALQSLGQKRSSQPRAEDIATKQTLIAALQSLALRTCISKNAVQLILSTSIQPTTRTPTPRPSSRTSFPKETDHPLSPLCTRSNSNCLFFSLPSIALSSASHSFSSSSLLLL